MNLYESIKNNLKEAFITDYVDEKSLEKMFYNNEILKDFRDIEYLDGMLIQFKGKTDSPLYKAVVTDEGVSLYLINEEGRQLSEPFLLEESISVPHYVTELPQEEQDILRKAIASYLRKEGYTGEEYNDGIDNAMESKIYDIDDTIRLSEDPEALKIMSKYVFLDEDTHNDLKAEIDEEINFRENDEETSECTWCKEEYPEEELNNEKNMGLLCDDCVRAIQSRGETLTILEKDTMEDTQEKNEDDESDDKPMTVPEYVEKNIEDEEEAIDYYNKFIAFVKENKPEHSEKIIEVIAEIMKDEEDHINKLVGIDNNDFDVKDQDEKELNENEQRNIIVDPELIKEIESKVDAMAGISGGNVSFTRSMEEVLEKIKKERDPRRQKLSAWELNSGGDYITRDFKYRMVEPKRGYFVWKNLKTGDYIVSSDDRAQELTEVLK